ncbi:MAG TPA: thioredoxin family protein, partial [Pyrinomonadaceae bacterium]|nr:thioredoxin family protein [Pyrinomonadaceae bacterium]
MKKFGYIFLMILAASVGVFAQTNGKKVGAKPAVSSEPKVDREKFDPTRNASTDLQNAVTKATAENKRIILDIGGEWCVWCRIMDYYLIENKDLGKIVDENFVWLKINMSPENENKEFLAKYPEIQGYPHL